MSWVIKEADFFGAKFKSFRKKNPNEIQLLFNNLDTFYQTLQRGVNPVNIKIGFIHNEPDGVKALDQKGTRPKGMGKPKQARLYIFADVETRILHIITVGDKRTQSDDIKRCSQFVRRLKSQG